MNYLKPTLLLGGVFIVSLISLSLSAQAELIAQNTKLTEPLAQEQAEAPDNSLIVDVKSTKSSSYPSMEEEMAMYMKLKSSEPQAFFFPNPSNGVVWIEHNLGKECTLTISDESKKVIFTAKNLQTQKLDLTSFKSGKYVLKLHTSKAEVSRVLTVL